MRVELRASPYLALFTLGVHGGAAAILLALLPPPAGLGGAFLLAILAGFSVRRQALLWAPEAPVGLELGRDASLLVRLRDGTELHGKASGRRYVNRWLVVLDLVRPGAKRRTILVAGDMLPAGEFRHMRLWALWDAIPAGHAGACA
ncbi:MAG: hypothetical protein JSS40_15775 [Proteobacteria bacterium]|nr:hypothetical protein [Pseudomonadota bacterium]